MTEISVARAVNWMVSTVLATLLLTEWPRIVAWLDASWKKGMQTRYPTWARVAVKWNAIGFGCFGLAMFFGVWLSVLHRGLSMPEAIGRLAPGGGLVIGGLIVVLLRNVYSRAFNLFLPPGQTSRAAAPIVWTTMGWILMLIGHILVVCMLANW